MSALKQHLKTGQEKLMATAADKRERRMGGGEGSSSIRPKPHIDVMSAIQIAIPTVVFFLSISDAATTKQEINKIKNKNIISDRRRPLWVWCFRIVTSSWGYMTH